MSNGATAAARSALPATTPTAAAWTDCRLCGCRLVVGTAKFPSGDDTTRGLCRDCITRPEASRFGVVRPGPTATSAPRPPQGGTGAVRPGASAGGAEPRKALFSGSEKALIRSCLKTYMPAKQLLELLNNRRVLDLGDDAVLITMEQLWEEGKQFFEAERGSDWSDLRKSIANARKSGLLAQITSTLLDDFATVFQLSAAQRTHLRDVIRSAQEGQ